jgi:NAD(P)-dependent dehydrogenase (short-subunit alcohol dehydrogenase family)
MPRLDDRPVAVVTGAAGGIGLELVKGLLAAGHHVLAVVRREASIARLPRIVGPARLATVVADVTTRAGRQTVREVVHAEFGGMTALVNNAAIGMGSIRPDYYKHPVLAPEVDVDVLDRFMQTNAVAPVALALEILPAFGRGWGRIMNVGTSLTAMLRPGFLPYAMSKAALESASAVLAKDLAPSNIAVCVLNPGGPVDTPMARRDEEHLRAGLIPPAQLVAPVCWALQPENGAAIQGKRLTTTLWRADDPGACLAPIGWPQLANDSSWR